MLMAAHAVTATLFYHFFLGLFELAPIYALYV